MRAPELRSSCLTNMGSVPCRSSSVRQVTVTAPPPAGSAVTDCVMSHGGGVSADVTVMMGLWMRVRLRSVSSTLHPLLGACDVMGVGVATSSKLSDWRGCGVWPEAWEPLTLVG